MRSVLFLWTVSLLAQQGPTFQALEKERALGQRLASEIKAQHKPPANQAVDAYVKRIGAELTGKLQEATFDYQFDVISGGRWTEPIPLPGGHILIPLGSLLAARNEPEFACLLSHSIAHVVLRHGIRTTSGPQTASLASIPLIFIGGSGGSHADPRSAQGITPVHLLESQRTNELEADRFGLELAARAGYDVTAFERYVERTHPPDSKVSPAPSRELRLLKIRETIASLKPATISSSSNEEFQGMQQAVRLTAQQAEDRRPPTLRR